jgi:hypothetical protein
MISLLARSQLGAIVFATLTIFTHLFLPRSLRALEERLASDARGACSKSGGIPVVARDRRVSCAPSSMPEGAQP